MNKPERVEKLDVADTILSNVPWMVFMGATVTFLIILIKGVASIEDPIIKAFTLLCTVFASVKLFGWIRGPRIVYKTRDGKLVYE